MTRRLIVAATVIGVLATPGAAAAKRYTAYTGEAAPAPKSAPEGTELNAFQPARLRIRAGDKVRYLDFSFHTATVLGNGVARPALAVPAAGQVYSGLTDPQGNPFFFNGMQKFEYNAAAFGPSGDAVVRGDKETDSSGVFPAQSPTKPGRYTLTFAKPGTYQVVCLIHPGMKQTVAVAKKKAKRADTAASVRSRIVKQTRSLYKSAGRAAKVVVPQNTVYVGSESKNATLLSFLPKVRTVAAGTTVTFLNHAPTEVHNMTWGPSKEGEYVDQFQKAADQLPTGPGSPNQFPAPFIYGTEAPDAAGVFTYTGNEYGNGFFWSQLLDDQDASPLQQSMKIKFDTPGTYTYFCAIHGRDMSGTIQVQ